MRQLARLLVELRYASNTPDANLSSYLKPQHFDAVVQAVLTVSRFQNSTTAEPPKLMVPSLALKLGYALRKCCTLLVNKALREKDSELEYDAASFAHIYDSEWQSKVSSVALKTIAIDKRNKPDLLPLTADLVKIKQYLESVIAELSDNLCAQPTAETYLNLVDCTLSRVILFNKRRGGEASRMTLNAYEHVHEAPSQSGIDDIGKTLSRTEQQLCHRLKIAEIAGKRNRTVPVLLTPDVIYGINAIIRNRETVGVNPQNQFVFARCSGLNPVDPFVSLRKVAECAGAERSDLVRSTKLRKYIATVSQVLDMRRHELSLLCRHMGHSLQVHEDFYRMPSHTLELAKVSKLLIAVVKGDLTQLTGKTLDDLNIADIPDDVGSDDSETDQPENSLVDIHNEVVAHTGSTNDGQVVSRKKRKPKQSDRECIASTSTAKTQPQSSGKDADGQDAAVTSTTERDDGYEDSDFAASGVTEPIKKRKMSATERKLPRAKTRKCIKTPWSADEKAALFRQFASHIKERRVPGKVIV